ncbi:zinc-binding dehydrogenase [Cryobacterium sp. M23]|uniref:zinc-dependent alcohol dehydrogenase n=1 Tax=Cryobacterium sp. M23 TaxID=2048292 RepID=UPI0018EA8BAB|nr:alcohol dehydrogenase catalytic domain-containing protein [Cryobacterium sp. M23]
MTNSSSSAAKNEMKAAVWIGPDSLHVRTVPMPTVPWGHALVRIELTGLCGTDFSILHGTHPRAAAPAILGHEITGIVETASEGSPAVGTRVAVEPLVTCGSCGPCKAGNSHVCTKLRLHGIDSPGSLAEYVALPVGSLIPIDARVPLREAALAEPLAVAVHAVHRSGLAGGETVMVFGAGPIGILTALVARNAGAGQILISEPSEERRLVAADLGFETVPGNADPVECILQSTEGAGADIVFDSAAHPSVAANLAKSVRVLGTIVLVGVYKKPAEVDLQALTFAENTVVGVRVYTRADFEEAVALIESGVLGLERIPVEVFPLDHVAEAFERAMAASGCLKVFVSSQEAVAS